ncbi:hypothetical protein [Polaribacter sp.]|uniref:hypothetical protein n=1 Tax=Polaribacter sp. TaxID=1920175 RepID=UPI003EF37F2C
MKKLLLVFGLLLSFQTFSQLKNTIVTVDLSKPQIGNVTIKTGYYKENKENKEEIPMCDESISSTNQLEVNYRNTLSFNFINGNPLKYKYVINRKEVNLFEGQSNPLNNENGQFNQKDNEVITDIVKVVDIEAINCLEPCYIKKLDTLKTKTSLLLENIKSFIKVNTAKETIDYKEISKKSKQFSILNVQYLSIKNNLEAAMKKTDFSSNFIDTFKTLTDTFKEIDTLLSKLFRVTTFTYTLPIDVNGKNIDYVEVTLERYDLKTNALVDSYPYRVWVTGGIKIDISGGLFFTSLKDDAFYTKDNSAKTGEKFIYQKDIGKYDYGFGSVINVKFRDNNYITPMFSFGALFTADQRFQFLAGGGVSFGKDERIILHLGVAMGKVKRLADGYELASSTESYSLENSTVPLTDRFDTGFVFGLTYNLGKTNAKKE